MTTVARSFRLKKSVDDAITELMGEESRNRNNLVEILLEEAIQNRRSAEHAVSGKKQIKPARKIQTRRDNPSGSQLMC